MSPDFGVGRRKTTSVSSHSGSERRVEPVSAVPTLADQVTPAEWAAKYQEAQVRLRLAHRSRFYPTWSIRLTLRLAQAAATRATKLELARDYDAAFETYLAAAQTYMFLLRHTVDSETKQRMRSVSGKLVERAEKIKHANKLTKKPVARDGFSIGQLRVPRMPKCAPLNIPIPARRGAGHSSGQRCGSQRTQITSMDIRGCDAVPSEVRSVA